MQDRHVYEKCPLCDEVNFQEHLNADCSKHPLYNKELSPRIKWNKCDSCQHIFTNGYFTDAAQNLIFSKTHENQTVGHNIEQNRKISSKIVEKILPLKKSGVWLDVGFGNASLLFTAQEFGFEPIGVDLRQKSVDTLSALGIEAHCKDINAIELPKKCSVVSLMDVLEHVPYPKPFLESVYSFLETNGVLLISMPNMESILWDLLSKNNANPYWGEIEHYHNFSRTRLYSLLNDFGFSPVRYGISERYRVCMEVVAVKR